MIGSVGGVVSWSYETYIARTAPLECPKCGGEPRVVSFSCVDQVDDGAGSTTRTTVEFACCGVSATVRVTR
jgi:hypothetical protein